MRRSTSALSPRPLRTRDVVGDPIPVDIASAVARAGLPPITYFEEVDSTNDAALQLANDGAPEFSAVLAGAQRAGRGRRGRTWYSPPGAGMYLLVVVRGDELGSRISLLTLAAGVAAVEAVEAVSDLRPELKWPNDLVVGRPWRKLAGILCEATGIGAGPGAIVVGLGANLERTAYPSDVADRATSLDVEGHRRVAIADLVAGFLACLREHVQSLRSGRPDDVLDRWREFGRAGLDAAPVRWHDERGLCRGMAYGLADDGALMVRRDGQEERLTSGEVVWEMLSRV